MTGNPKQITANTEKHRDGEKERRCGKREVGEMDKDGERVKRKEGR